MPNHSPTSIELPLELLKEVETLLRPGEDLSAFVEGAIRSKLAARVQRRDSVARSLAASSKAEETGCYIAADQVVGRLRDVFADALHREARMFATAQAATLEAATWLTAAQVGQLAGWDPSEADARLGQWLREGRIFAIRVESQELFPSYGIDPSDSFMPLKHLADVITILSPHKDSWGIAIWFASINSFLSGKRPQDMIVDQSSAVIAAAKDEVQGVLHG